MSWKAEYQLAPVTLTMFTLFCNKQTGDRVVTDILVTDHSVNFDFVINMKTAKDNLIRVCDF